MATKLFPILAEMTSGQTGRQMGRLLGLEPDGSKLAMQQALALGLGGLVHKADRENDPAVLSGFLDQQDATILDDLAWLSERDLAQRWVEAGRLQLQVLWGDQLDEVLRVTSSASATGSAPASDVTCLTTALVVAVVLRQLRSLGLQGDAAREFILEQRPDVMEAAPALQQALDSASGSAQKTSEILVEARRPTFSVGAASAAHLRGQTLDAPGHYGEGEVTERLVAMAQEAARRRLILIARIAIPAALVALVGCGLWWGLPLLFRGRDTAGSVAEGGLETAQKKDDQGKSFAKRAPKSPSQQTVTDAAKACDLLDLLTQRVATVLDGVRDASSAARAVPRIEAVISDLHRIPRSTFGDPEAPRLHASISDAKAGLRERTLRLNQLPGADQHLRQVLTSLAQGLHDLDPLPSSQASDVNQTVETHPDPDAIVFDLDWAGLTHRTCTMLERVQDESSARRAAQQLELVCRQIEDQIPIAQGANDATAAALRWRAESFKQAMRKATPRLNQLPPAAAELRPSLTRLAAALNQVLKSATR